MLALTLIRLLVLVLRLWIGSGNMHAWRLYALAELLSFSGGACNAIRFPEGLVKSRIQKGDQQDVGRFDYWFSSHQIMHILVVMAIFSMRTGLTSDCQYLRNHPVICVK